MITRVTHRTQAAALRRLGIPVVNVSRSVVPGYSLSAGRQRRTRVGPPGGGSPDAAWLSLAGLLPGSRISRTTTTGWGRPSPRRSVRPGAERARLLDQWRRRTAAPQIDPRRSGAAGSQSLEKPVGILAWDAEQGHFLREACASAGLRIPDEVAIVSGEDDELFCKVSYPPLSAVDCGSERIGYEAAALLASLPGRRSCAEEHRLPIRPVGRVGSALDRRPGDGGSGTGRGLEPTFALMRLRATSGARRATSRCPFRGGRWSSAFVGFWAARRRPKCGGCVSPGRRSCWPAPTGRCRGLRQPPAFHGRRS